MPKKFWTPERVDRLRVLVGEQRPTKYLAGYFGVSRDSIRQTMHRFRVKRLVKVEKAVVGTDWATRFDQFNGSEAVELVSQGDCTDEQLRSWRDGTEGCVLFCREALSIELQDYQVKMVEAILTKKNCVFVMGRQCGKDFLISCLVPWLAVTRPREKILLVSASQLQCDLMYERIRRVFLLRGELVESVLNWTKKAILLKNGSLIRNLPSTAHMRGETEATIAILNEARDFQDQNVLGHLTPMLGIKDGKLVVMSSPAGCTGILWECFTSDSFFKMRVETSANKYFSKEHLADARTTLSSLQYSTEYEAQFSETVANFFPQQLIQKCTRDYEFQSNPEPDKTYFMGIDWGRRSDATVILVVSQDVNRVRRVEFILELEKTDFEKQLGAVRMLSKQFNCSQIVAEDAGLSGPLVEELKKDLPVFSFKPTTESKANAFLYLRKEMEANRVIIPASHKKMQLQLSTFRYEVTKNGNLLLHHASPTIGDDIVDALCLSIKATYENWGAAFIDLGW